jgi:hypothetical protein
LRFGRILVAPLLGLSALLAAMAAGPFVANGVSSKHGGDSLARLLRTVGHLVLPSAEAPTPAAAADRPSPQTVLPFAALASTPLRHALWMIASLAAIDFAARRHQRALLRC